MLYSKSSQYAIRALAYLTAHSNGKLCRLESIAAGEQIPQHFLAKILQRLVKKRLVKSSKGIKGGFALNLPPDQISLYLIVDAIDDASLLFQDCIFGERPCSEETRCPLHESWKELRSKQIDFLKNVTLTDLLTTVPVQRLNSIK
jgi:Rrf2 family protein